MRRTYRAGHSAAARNQESATACAHSVRYNRSMHAELAYLFRHAVLRDAAYLLLVPQDRAALHWLAVSVLQGVLHPTEQDAAGPR